MRDVETILVVEEVPIENRFQRIDFARNLVKFDGKDCRIVVDLATRLGQGEEGLCKYWLCRIYDSC